MSRPKQTRTEKLYQKWLKGVPIKELQNEFGITRQRIYQVLQSKGVTNRDKTLRMVNQLTK